MNTAASMRVAGDRVAVYRGSPLSVRVGGRPVLLSKELRLPHGGTVTPLRRGQIEVVWPDGSIVRVVPTGDLMINLVVSLAASRSGKVTGLLGNSNGSPTDDFVTRGGRRLSPAVVRGTGARARAALYRAFGDSWRVTRRGTLFDYAPGQSTQTLSDRRFPARLTSAGALAPAARNKAEAVCRGLRIASDQVRENCVLDVASTGNFAFATAAATTEKSAKQKGEGGAKPPPQPGSPPPPQPPPPAVKGLRATLTFQGKTLTFQGAKGDEGCRPFRGSTPYPGVGFRIVISKTGGPRPLFILSVIPGTKDGTYTTGAGGIFQTAIQGKRVTVGIENATVTLAGNRSRGTFRGDASTPGKDAVSGSFSCA